MKKNILTLLLLICAGIFTANPVLAQNNIDKIELRKRIDKLIENYEYYGVLAESFNANQLSPAFIEQFKALFHSTAMVYNDVRQSTSFEQKIPLNDYIAILSEWYPNGLIINIDVIEMGDVSKSQLNGYKYQIGVLVSKSVGGFTKENKDYREADLVMQMIVSFNDNFDGMKILQIRSEQEILKEEAQLAVKDTPKPKKNQPKDEPKKTGNSTKVDTPKAPKVKPVKTSKPPKVKTQVGTAMSRAEDSNKAKRWYIGFRGGVDYNIVMGGVNNENLDSVYLDAITDLGVASTIGWRFSANVQRFWSEKLGVGVGLSYVQTPLLLQNGRINTTYTATDADGETFDRTFRAINLSESYVRNTLNIPITFYYQGYSNSKKETMRWYVGLSIEPQIQISYKNTFSGGFYSENNYGNALNNLKLQDLSPNNQAEQANMEKYYLYGRSETNELLDDAPITTTTKAKGSVFGLNGGAEVGIDWFPTRKSNWCISFSANASMGLLSLFNGNYSNKDMLLKQRMAVDIESDNLNDMFSTGTTNYTPLEDGYEYRSIWNTMNSRLLTIGATVGVKYQIMGSDVKKKNLFVP